MNQPIRKPKTRGGVVYLLVVAAALVGLGVVAWSDWRRGVVVIGAALLGGAVWRYFLGEFDSGMLRVRRRWFDVSVMIAVGVLLIMLATTIPNQPGA